MKKNYKNEFYCPLGNVCKFYFVQITAFDSEGQKARAIGRYGRTVRVLSQGDIQRGISNELRTHGASLLSSVCALRYSIYIYSTEKNENFYVL